MELITDQEIPSALPIVQLRYPEMTADSWERHVRGLLSTGGGVAAVRCERGYIYGILMYEPIEESGGERVLNVKDIVALKLTGQENVRSLMLEWSDQRARELNCERIDISLK